jgi:hypothetical protein
MIAFERPAVKRDAAGFWEHPPRVLLCSDFPLEVNPKTLETQYCWGILGA